MTAAAPSRAGLLAAFLAFFLWGLFPLYWKLLAHVPSLEVVGHRTAWGFVSVAAWVTLRRAWAPAREVARDRRAMAVLAASAALIGVNWLMYIWSVANGHVTEASLGYYINPLVNVLLGVIVLRERLSGGQAIAVALAAVGVLVLTVGYGRFPWISVALAVSFGLYGLLRKTVAADAVSGLLWETALLTPLAVAYLLLLERRGIGAFGGDARSSLLLAAGGAVTAVPLVLFAAGARALPLSTVGLVQYLSPTIQFLLAVFLYREPFTRAHAVAFVCIWAALALLTRDLRRRLRRA